MPQLLTEGTDAYIIVKHGDTDWRGQTVHWDGYKQGVGNTLQDHYDHEKAKQLYKLGQLSSLDKDLAPAPGVSHSWQKPAEGVTVAYARDRGEKKAGFYDRHNSLEDALGEAWNHSYTYVHDGEGWKGMMSGSGDRQLKPIDMLPESTITEHWFHHKKVGRYTILQGAGVNGGEWMAKETGTHKPETKTFKSAAEAEDHAYASQPNLEEDTVAENDADLIVSAALDGDAATLKGLYNSAVRARISQAIDDIRPDVAQGIFGEAHTKAQLKKAVEKHKELSDQEGSWANYAAGYSTRDDSEEEDDRQYAMRRGFRRQEQHNKAAAVATDLLKKKG